MPINWGGLRGQLIGIYNIHGVYGILIDVLGWIHCGTFAPDFRPPRLAVQAASAFFGRSHGKKEREEINRRE